ncbi:hypothetical protein HAX54_035905 [Datura stramonium]|uniref:Uncharacterized protein n=1 Tax=Datura stramonium TaxID=4076 RepID=A0ABS8SFS1_DATST|nr:hypothetical protein [Datura stramonium]
MGRRLYPVLLGIQSQSVSHSAKRELPVMSSVATSVNRRSTSAIVLSHKGQASMSTSNAQNRFGLDRMEEYYVSFKEKRSIYAKAQFEVESLKSAFPDISNLIGMRDWGPYTIHVDPYFLELVWEFYVSYKAQQRLLKHKGCTDTLSCLPSVWNTTEVPIEVSILRACIMDHVHINVGENIADKFKRRAKKQATSLPYPSLVSMLCVRASFPLFWPLDKTLRVDSVITLATKIEKDAPATKQTKSTENRTPPPPSAPLNTSTDQFHAAVAPTTTPHDFLKLAQRAQLHEIQLMKLSKASPSMI